VDLLSYMLQRGNAPSMSKGLRVWRRQSSPTRDGIDLYMSGTLSS
jgi:hypothetical protein